jgi:hypothetical protein
VDCVVATALSKNSTIKKSYQCVNCPAAAAATAADVDCVVAKHHKIVPAQQPQEEDDSFW